MNGLHHQLLSLGNTSMLNRNDFTKYSMTLFNGSNAPQRTKAKDKLDAGTIQEFSCIL